MRPPRYKMDLRPPIWWWVAMVVLMVLSVTACKSTESVIETHDTDHKSEKVVQYVATHDTTIIRDSVIVIVTDTNRVVERWRDRLRIVIKTDTMYIAKMDTIIKTYTEVREVARAEPNALRWLRYLIILVALCVIYKVIRKLFG